MVMATIDDDNKSGTTDEDDLVDDIWSFASDDYKSTVVPFYSQRDKQSALEQADERYKMSNGLTRPHRILKPKDVESGRVPRWTELELNGNIRNLPAELFTDFKHLTGLFINRNQLARIPPEISQLKSLVVLDLSHNKLRSLPAEIGDMTSLCHLYLSYNSLRAIPYEIGKLHRLTTLGLHGNPLQNDIMKIYVEPQGTQKLMQFLLDHLAINTPVPPERQWLNMLQTNRDKHVATFTAMCYNVLCDKYATNNLYSYCPTWALNWEYRKGAILKELKQWETDIIALQEVETEQYHKLFLPEMEALGYAGTFSPKSRAKTMSEEERRYVDGCAIFWKTDKFELESEHLIEFTQLAMSRAEGSKHILNRVMPRDNIGICAVLKAKQTLYNNPSMIPSTLLPQDNVTGSPVVIFTSHIHWDPEFCDVKLVQTMMLVHELQTLLHDLGDKHHAHNIPLLICGDLNSLPRSGVCEYLLNGSIDSAHVDFKDLRNNDIGRQVLAKMSSSGEEGLLNQQVYTHNLQLSTAYDDQLMPYTNYTLDFKGMIDYMLSSPALTRLGILAPIDPQWFVSGKVVGCPHPHVPSDHFPLLAQYAILPPSYVGRNHNLLQPMHGAQQMTQQQRHMGTASASQQYRHIFQNPSQQSSAFGVGFASR